MEPIMIVGIILITGFIFGEVARKIKLPKVTGYILAGIFLNPQFLPIIPLDFPSHTGLITNVALTFITFSVGGTLLFSRIKKLGKGIVWITVCEAEFAFLIVAVGFLIATPFFLNVSSASWLVTFIPVSLLLASLAAPTDPSATLAITHEYKAKGEVSSTIMGVAAFDDVLGIINYSVVVVIAAALVKHAHAGFNQVLLSSLLSVCGAVLLGALFGWLLNFVSSLIQRETEGMLIVLIFWLLSLCFGLSTILGVDELLATMTMGVIVVNFNKKHEKIFKMLERYTEELIFVLFFTLSGMHLDFGGLVNSFWLVLLFVVLRTFGKVTGSVFGAVISKSSKKVRRYVAGGLIPQGGIVVGLALLMSQNPAFSDFSNIILSIIIGATVFHELLGPVIAKMTLIRAGEIKK